MGRAINGTINLLHFASKYRHAGHYLGWADDLAARLEQHATGRGARLTSVIQAAGIGFECVRTWPGTRRNERKLKNRRCAPCSARSAMKNERPAGGNWRGRLTAGAKAKLRNEDEEDADRRDKTNRRRRQTS